MRKIENNDEVEADIQGKMIRKSGGGKMDERLKNIKKIADEISSRTEFKPEIALILGSGLGVLVDEIQVDTIIFYSDIAGFPVPTVAGHAGRIIFGCLCEKNIVAFEGRKHYYECKDMEQATLITKIIKMMGVNKIILTNAAGGIGPDMQEGDIMMIKDHISSFVPSPLLGKNIDELGARFPDMTEVYDSEVNKKVCAKAKEINVSLTEGVYLQTTGPNYETPAEIKMYASLGANAVGMSTACEAMVAKHMGMKICGISCITNMAAGLGNKELSHEDVKKVVQKSSHNFKSVVKEAVKVM